MKNLHPKAVWLFFVQYGTVAALLALVIGIFVFQSILNYSEGASSTIGEVLRFSATGTIILVFLAVITAYIWSRLSYKYYRYELREDGFRKESGVIWKKYVTIPYDRIQNVDINRGIWDRILGLSDLQIQTAGSSSAVTGEGRLPGLSQAGAEVLRDDLIHRARQSRNQGI